MKIIIRPSNESIDINDLIERLETNNESIRIEDLDFFSEIVYIRILNKSTLYGDKLFRFILSEKHYSSNNLTDFEYLLLLLGSYQINNVIFLKKDEMPLDYIYSSKKYKFKDLIEPINPDEPYMDETELSTSMRINLNNYLSYIELMGCFVIVNDTLKNELKEKGYTNQLLNNGDYTIIICKENIDKTAKLLDPNYYYGYDMDFYELFYRIIYYHELGHCIFSYIDKNSSVELKEKQANFFVSLYLHNKSADELIKRITDKQLPFYNNPYLISDNIPKKNINTLFRGDL